ncbi:NAD(P)-dependent oxidoreductase [Paracoccus sp. SCSIO 75233]|uniref:NAD-dependent epimerase/dehydratase family protein n=1 Tax=Paracoccus sp. SCSIO 75233 TaxID=3017782 RepID=UPI0022F041D0|nr:NAD(P)-dependent oxidoreductase [Paracoccus sp. SCSIO 75233]WBU52360.1 NAD(P)-dependent oxidoreductase [Paracoccus sp. SCSIO 75233]
MARVVITGGTGFIGSHLVRDCLCRGDQVTIFARPGSDLWRLRDVLGQLRVERLDFGDRATMAAALRRARAERMFLLASEIRFREGGMDGLPEAIDQNLRPLHLLLQEIAALDTPPDSIVRAGTLAELAKGDPDCEHPDGVYGLSILIGTNMLRIWRAESGIPAVTARLGLVYGATQPTSFFIPYAVNQALTGRLDPPRQPMAQRDLLYVSDAVSALQLIADHAPDLPPSVTVSTGKPHCLAEITERIARLTGQPFDPISGDSSAPRNIVSAPPSPELIGYGWRPRVPLDDGLRELVDWETRRLALNTASISQ